MQRNLTHKILEAHLVEGKLIPGEEIGITIDHTLLQDATGTMAMLEFESLGIDRVKAELSVQYVDHNILQTDNKNAEDHVFLRTACAKYGIHFSPPGNGLTLVCVQFEGRRDLDEHVFCGIIRVQHCFTF